MKDTVCRGCGTLILNYLRAIGDRWFENFRVNPPARYTAVLVPRNDDEVFQIATA